MAECPSDAVGDQSGRVAASSFGGWSIRCTWRRDGIIVTIAVVGG